MKTLTNIVRYKCEHCGREMQRKHAMEKHEKYCTKNPNNTTWCSDCIFLHKEPKTITDPNGYDRYTNSFKCTKLNKTLYPKKVEKLGLLDKYPETFIGQEPMPIRCSEYKAGF